MNSGQVVTVSTPVTINLPGEHVFYAQANTAAGGTRTVTESNGANNIRGPMTTTVGVPKADLVIVSLTTAPAEPLTNQPLTLTVVVKNQGYLAAGSTFRVDWYADPANPPVSGQSGNGYQNVSGLGSTRQAL